MENKEKRGWVVMTQCLGGDELAWRVTEEGEEEDNPEIFESNLEAWKAVAEHQIDIMDQFIREGDDPETVDWAPSVYPARIVIYADGELMVYDGDDNAPQPILVTTLEKWRKNT